MKNKCNESSMLYAAVLVTAIITLAACKHEAGKPKPKTYAVTMEYDAATGTASASPNPAAKGQAVTVTAEAAGNYKFKLWELVSGDAVLSSFIANPALFTMPDGPVTIRAEFTALADIILDEVTYGYEQPAKRNVPISALGLDTQTVSGIALASGEESPFELDETDINNKIAVGNVLGFYVQPKVALKAGSYSDAINITHGGGKTTVFNIMITVNPKQLTLNGLTAEDKEYDGTVDAVISGTAVLEGFIEGDDVVLREGAAVFEDKNAGEAKNILLDGFSLSGTDACNYTLSSMQEGLTADITPRPVMVTVTGIPSNITLLPFGSTDLIYLGRSYRQSTDVGLTVNGFLPDDTVTIKASENIYGLSGSIESNSTGTLTIGYDGSEVTETSPVRVNLEATGNYRLDAAQQILVSIIDGFAIDRWLPVAMENITDFNNYARTSNGLNRHYRLIKDITLDLPQANESNWTSIGTANNRFTGSFDGNGYVINNIIINSTLMDQGLFGVIAEEGTIRNVALCDIILNGSTNAGSQAGTNYGTIENGYVTGLINGNNNIGGIVGRNFGIIKNCYCTGNIKGIQYIGGLVGINDGTGTLQYSYATGRVSGISDVGGVIGHVSLDAGVSNCVALNNIVENILPNYANIGRVAGSSNSLGLINNYAQRHMNINKTVSEGLNTIDGNNIISNIYRFSSWWSGTINWNGVAWNFSTLWQMNGKNLPKLRNVGGSQNHVIKVSQKMVQIPAGSFTMGSPAGETGRKADEGPQHTVSLGGFFIGAYEVTYEMYNLLMLKEVDYSYSEYPLVLNWYEALVFCNTLSMEEGLSPAYSINNSTDPTEWGNVPTVLNTEWNSVEIVPGSTGYRLPTEAQWEYACRAETITPWNTGASITTAQARFSDSTTTSVGSYAPNAWGLYDMHGNINEWCWDWYDSYTDELQENPQGQIQGTRRVCRGGSYPNIAADIRSAVRSSGGPQTNFSLRLVRP